MNLVKKITKESKKYFKWENWCHDFEHTRRVYNLCMHIWKIENADLEVLEIASLLHDIWRREENKCKWKVCHAKIWWKKAREILSEFKMDKNKLENIIHCIEAHRFSWGNKPDSIEAKVLFDSDKLDSIWAIWIGRAFLFAWEIWAKLHNKDKDLEKTKRYSKDDTAYREFMLSLRKKKDKMLTEEWKKLAEERHNYMVQFFDRLNKEVDGEI